MSEDLNGIFVNNLPRTKDDEEGGPTIVGTVNAYLSQEEQDVVFSNMREDNPFNYEVTKEDGKLVVNMNPARDRIELSVTDARTWAKSFNYICDLIESETDRYKQSFMKGL